jgi:hypothetical protein
MSRVRASSPAQEGWKDSFENTDSVDLKKVQAEIRDNGSGILEIVFTHHGVKTKEKLRSKRFDNGEEQRFFLLQGSLI